MSVPVEPVDNLLYVKIPKVTCNTTLPCMPGDMLYSIWSCGNNGYSIAKFRVVQIILEEHGMITIRICAERNFKKSGFVRMCYRSVDISEIGVKMFTSYKCVEDALYEKIKEKKVGK